MNYSMCLCLRTTFTFPVCRHQDLCPSVCLPNCFVGLTFFHRLIPHLRLLCPILFSLGVLLVWNQPDSADRTGNGSSPILTLPHLKKNISLHLPPLLLISLACSRLSPRLYLGSTTRQPAASECIDALAAAARRNKVTQPD